MTKRWTIREARTEDAADIERFLVGVPEFADTLKSDEQRHVWQWLYTRIDKPVSDVLIAQDSGGAIVAHYGLAHLPYLLEGRKADAGIACLLAIADDYRKTHMFLELTRKLLQQFRAANGAFVTGLANRAGLLEFHKAFGFADIGEVSIFVKPLRPSRIVANLAPRLHRLVSPLARLGEIAWLALLKFAARPSSTRIRIEPIDRFDAATAASTCALGNHHKFFADRTDAAILNNRFFGLDCRTYHAFRIVEGDAVLGYVALRLMDMKGFYAAGVVDICFDFARRDVAREVFRAIDRFAIAHNAEVVSILTNSTPLIAALRRHLFLKAPESFRLVILELTRTLALKSSRIDDWYVTWFEHDFV